MVRLNISTKPALASCISKVRPAPHVIRARRRRIRINKKRQPRGRRSKRRRI